MTSGNLAAQPGRWATGWRRLTMAATMLLYPAITAFGVAQYSRGADAVAGYLIVAAFACCYVLAVLAAFRFAWTWFWTLFAAMVVLFFAAFPFAQVQAFFLCAVVLSIVVNRWRRRAIPLVVVSVAGSLVAATAVPSWRTGQSWIYSFGILCTVLFTYAFAETMHTTRQLAEARAEVARLSADAERTRIARDLHDLLGHSLTAITLKSDLARRLAEAGSDRSAHEIAEVEQLSRQTLADVRAAVSGYRDVTLTGELARGRELLRASGVTADLPTATDLVDTTYQELFGWAVREGVTNVARHARATRCTVTVSASEVEIRDDGVGDSDRPGAGNGLAGLRERAEAAGATVEAGPLRPRGWRLRVRIEPKAATAV